MTVTPVKARCTRCRGDFALAELLDRRDGCCPRCGGRLTDDWTAVLLDEARRVGLAQEHLATSLRRLRELPGTLALLPHPVVRLHVDDFLPIRRPVRSRTVAAHSRGESSQQLQVCPVRIHCIDLREPRAR